MKSQECRFFVNGMGVDYEAFIRYLKRYASDPTVTAELLVLNARRQGQ